MLSRLPPVPQMSADDLYVLFDPANNGTPRFPGHIASAIAKSKVTPVSYKWLLFSISCYELRPMSGYVDAE